MKIVLASNNKDKAKEIQAFLGNDFTIVLQSEFNIEEVAETGSSFVENSLIKAYHCARLTGLPTIADDSGLCVPALTFAPGINSATYSGVKDSKANMELLLHNMADLENDERDAFYCCALSLVTDHNDPVPMTFFGFWQGIIHTEPLGNNGFGYDPIFMIPELNKTAAQLTLEEKNTLSHRGQALADLKEELMELLKDNAE